MHVMMNRGRNLVATAVSGVVVLLVAVVIDVAPPLESQAQAGPGDGGSQFSGQGLQGRVVPPVLDDIEQMCALLTTCSGLPIPTQYAFGNDFSKCVSKMSDSLVSPSAVGFSLAVRECGLSSNSCDGLLKCLLRGADPKGCDGRGTSGPIGFCDVDGRALTCDHGKVAAVRDCLRGGEQCFVSKGQSLCSLGHCSDTDVAGPHCSASGSRVLQCEAGRVTSLDCAVFGLRCVDEKNGAPAGKGAACATTSPTCVEGAKRCDGKTEIGCYHGHEVRTDCGAAGLTCDPSSSSPVGVCAVPKESAGGCSNGDAPKCDGGNIKYCEHGRPRSYHCTTLLNKCEKDKDGVRCTR
jgi:hypothetical protein